MVEGDRMTVPIHDQLKCAKREVAMRRANYPRWTAAGKMTAEKAASEIAAMEAICATLERQKLLTEISEEMKNQPKEKKNANV
jgi:hypothetical protein